MASSLRDSPSSADNPAGRILAIDYGRRRIGLAISDPLGVTSTPLATLTRTNRRNLLRQLREIVRRHDVRRIVIGHPLNLNGSSGEMAAEAARFATRLEKELGLPTELVDERLTSWEAKQVLAEGKRSPRQRRSAVDAVAAAVILQDYLEREQARKQTKS